MSPDGAYEVAGNSVDLFHSCTWSGDESIQEESQRQTQNCQPPELMSFLRLVLSRLAIALLLSTNIFTLTFHNG